TVIFFFQAEDGIRDKLVTGVQTCALPISSASPTMGASRAIAPMPVSKRLSPTFITILRRASAHSGRSSSTRAPMISFGWWPRFRSEERRVGEGVGGGGRSEGGTRNCDLDV